MATKRPRRSAPIPERIIEAALELAATENWASVTLGAIAEKAGVSLVQLHGTFGSKAAILDAFVEKIDHAVLAGIGKEDLSESPRDRLFDSLMRRLDALQPRKAAIGSILRGARVRSVGARLCAAKDPQVDGLDPRGRGYPVQRTSGKDQDQGSRRHLWLDAKGLAGGRERRHVPNHGASRPPAPPSRPAGVSDPVGARRQYHLSGRRFRAAI